MILVASMIYAMTQIQVQVHGMSSSPLRVLAAFRHHSCPHSHLVSVVQMAWSHLSFVQETSDPLESARLGRWLHDSLAPFAHVIQHSWTSAHAWAPVYAQSFDCFPLAHRISSSHGRCLHDMQWDPPQCIPSQHLGCQPPFAGALDSGPDGGNHYGRDDNVDIDDGADVSCFGSERFGAHGLASESCSFASPA